jgi:hypothetical protein
MVDPLCHPLICVIIVIIVIILLPIQSTRTQITTIINKAEQ